MDHSSPLLFVILSKSLSLLFIGLHVIKFALKNSLFLDYKKFVTNFCTGVKHTSHLDRNRFLGLQHRLYFNITVSSLNSRFFCALKRTVLTISLTTVTYEVSVVHNVELAVFSSHIFNAKKQETGKYGDRTGNVKRLIIWAKFLIQPTCKWKTFKYLADYDWLYPGFQRSLIKPYYRLFHIGILKTELWLQSPS